MSLAQFSFFFFPLEMVFGVYSDLAKEMSGLVV